jgi:hypothetical protein
MKTGQDSLGTAKNESASENMKTGPDALGTAENEFGHTKHENGTRRPRNREATPSEPRSDALDTAENDFGSAKREKGTLRHWYRRKRVYERKT